MVTQEKTIQVVIFGLACLFWAIVLTIVNVIEKGKAATKGKQIQYNITNGILYILGLFLVFG